MELPKNALILGGTMGGVRGFINLVRNIATGGRDLNEMMKDGRYALLIIKHKIKMGIAFLLRHMALYIFIASLIIVVLLAAVSVVFEIFSIDMFGDKSAMTTVNPADMKEWSDSLSDEDIEKYQGYGASIHPRKIHLYAEIEDESYPKDVVIQIPKYIRTWGDGGSSESTVFLDYTYKRGESAYPYRQWWQSTASLDAVNDTGYREEEVGLIENARENLKPVFVWEDTETENYVQGSKYDHTSQKEEETIRTTTVKVTTSGDGKTNTDTSYTEARIYKPLPFINNVNTMFADVTFEYSPITETNSHTDTKVRKETRTKTKSRTKTRTNEDGTVEEYEEDYEVEYTVTITTVTTVDIEVNSWELVAESKNPHDQFMSFLRQNRIDTKSDPQMMYLMAENLPQSYDFTGEFAEYLTHMDMFYGTGGYAGIGPSGSYTGDFGDFVGGSFSWPVPSNTRITSFYGYRTHPVTGQKGKFHQGVDIAAGMGVDIVASGEGTVTYVGYLGSYGNTVMINHGGGIETLYAHNSRLVVSPGQKVSQGDVISKAGSTGRSTGPHLHFEIRKNGKYTEPLAWLRR